MWEHVLDVCMVHCFFDVGCLMPYACIMFEAVQDLTAHMVPKHFARKPTEYAGRVPLKHSRIDLGSDMKEAQNAIVEASASASVCKLFCKVRKLVNVCNECQRLLAPKAADSAASKIVPVRRSPTPPSPSARQCRNLLAS